jgi:hypothetical protein
MALASISIARAEELLAAVPPVGASAAESASAGGVLVGGYVESYYQWNFNAPTNGITNLRGFDNRHDTFTLANAALDLQWDRPEWLGRVTLQVGHTPSTYYLAEPTRPGADGANATGPELWKYLQQAYAGWKVGVGRGLVLSAGLFLSPIGPETMALLDSWHWSRSNLFFGLPFYHSGLRATYPLDGAWTLSLALYNGWNSVVDNNGAKSVAAHLSHASEAVLASFVYFGGAERAEGAPEGQPWRHLWDANATWFVSSRWALQGHVNAGFERGRLGTSSWGAAAAAARVRVVGRWFGALRGDVFGEQVAEGSSGRASPLFWPAPWVASVTATLEFRAADRASFRLEYRRDQAGGPAYFGDEATGGRPDRRTQQTLTAGLAAGL